MTDNVVQLASQREEEPPLTEPEIVGVDFVDGFTVEKKDGNVRIVGWQYIGTEGNYEERRIVTRLAMSFATARVLCAKVAGGEYLQ